MIGCEKNRGRLDDWLDGMLSPEAQAEVNDHLAFCEDCRRLFDAQLALQRDLVLLGQTADRMATSPSRVVRPSRWMTASKVLAMAACLVLLLSGGYALLNVKRGSIEVVRQDPGIPLVADDAVALGDLMVAPNDAARVQIEDAPDCLAVQVKSSRPNIHIVWMYGECTSDSTGKPDSESKS